MLVVPEKISAAVLASIFVARLVQRNLKRAVRRSLPCHVVYVVRLKTFANLGDIVIRASSCAVVFKTAVLQALVRPRNTPV